MQIKKFWAKGYRSLADVQLDDLGQVNVLYGPNGSGKSNVQDALQLLFHLMPIAIDSAFGSDDERISFREAGREAARRIMPDDFFARQETNEILLGAVVEDPISGFDGAQFQGAPVRRIQIEIKFWRVRPGDYGLKIATLYINGQKPGLPISADQQAIRDALRGIVPRSFCSLGATRTLSTKIPSEGAAFDIPPIGPITDSQIVDKLFRAKNSTDRATRDRFDELQKFIANTLGRGRFDVLMNSETGSLQLREALSEPNPLGLDIPVDRTGLGIVQLYAIIAEIKLSGARLVALEEPEAHLHAPTLGRKLHDLLQSMVADSTIHQLFISTHSNLFDLDLTGYFDVRIDENGKTLVERRPIHDIDQHLYEPGPTLHALEELLRISDPERIMARRPDGTGVSVKEMLTLLQAADPIALEYLKDLHRAAVDMVGLRARRKETGS